MGDFTYNPILRIGESQWDHDSFDYHEVAWEEECDVHNDVFDACLQVDGDANPTAADPDHIPLLPTNLRFGGVGNSYQFRLMAPTNPAGSGAPLLCQRTRRPIQHSPVVERSMVSQEVLDRTSHRFDFNHEIFALGAHKTFPEAVLPNINLEGWTRLRSDCLPTTGAGLIHESLWRSSTEEDRLVRLNIYHGISSHAARNWLLHAIASLHSIKGVEKKQVEFADAFFIIGRCGIKISLGNVVVSLTNVGKGKFLLSELAQSIVQTLADAVK
jgi:hypothetical protein